jgi:hypothetical protein
MSKRLTRTTLRKMILKEMKQIRMQEMKKMKMQEAGAAGVLDDVLQYLGGIKGGGMATILYNNSEEMQRWVNGLYPDGVDEIEDWAKGLVSIF